MRYEFTPIGVLHSCFKERFGIPRQPGLNKEARARLELHPPFDREEAFKEIEAFSHLWIVFVFHATMREEWKATVRPPRLGGNRRVGVFASRSNFRPNPVGISAVELEGVERTEGKVTLHLKGVDFLDGTPVLDIKPYIPYSDAIPSATDGFAEKEVRSTMEVEFHPEALKAILARSDIPYLQEFIVQMLANDPRPAYHSGQDPKERFGIRVFDMDVQWEVKEGRFWVTSIKKMIP